MMLLLIKQTLKYMSVYNNDMNQINKEIKQIKGIYLIKRWCEESDGYEIAAFGVDNNGNVHQGLSYEFLDETKKEIRNAKLSALESLVEENDDVDFTIYNVLKGEPYTINIDGSKIKMVYWDIRGSDLRGGYPDDRAVKISLGLEEDN